MIDHDKNKQIIEAATDGPWFIDRCYTDGCIIGCKPDDGPMLEVGESFGSNDSAGSDAAYIARFNPQYMREYEARMVELEGLLKVAVCPSNCTDGAYPDHQGEPVQCQFCYERNEVLNNEQ